MTIKHLRGFTLIELMISAALGLVLLGMVGYTMNTTSKAVNNTQALVSLHNRGRAIIAKMYGEFETMYPSLNNTFPGGSCLFLTTASSLDSNMDLTDDLNHEFIWVEYYLTGSGTPPLYYQLWRRWRKADINDITNFPTAGSVEATQLFDNNIESFSVTDSGSSFQVSFTLVDNTTGKKRAFGFGVKNPGAY